VLYHAQGLLQVFGTERAEEGVALIEHGCVVGLGGQLARADFRGVPGVVLGFLLSFPRGRKEGREGGREGGIISGAIIERGQKRIKGPTTSGYLSFEIVTK
jgi:hypothetical protein